MRSSLGSVRDSSPKWLRATESAATLIPVPAPTFKVLLNAPLEAEPPPVKPAPAVTVTAVISPTLLVYSELTGMLKYVEPSLVNSQRSFVSL